MGITHPYYPPDDRSFANGRSRRELVIGLCIPLGGSTGLWGPSSLAAAKLAVEELNAASGIAGRQCRLEIIDAADDSPDIEQRVAALVDAKAVDVLVGTHLSVVRDRILKAVCGRIPFVFTNLHEGCSVSLPMVFTIGETPAHQLRPAIAWLSRNECPQRWLLLGNDYVWPRVSHQRAKGYIAEAGGEVIDEIYLPLGTDDFVDVCERIESMRPDVILLSFPGQDSIGFNRTFGDLQLSDSIKRLSCAIEENELLGIGAANTQNLFVASSYFGSLDTDANLSFKERYYKRFGARAPTLNSPGQSTYEGIQFLAALFESARQDPDGWTRAGRRPVSYRSARNATYIGNTEQCAPIYMARAAGHTFDVITRL